MWASVVFEAKIIHFSRYESEKASIPRVDALKGAGGRSEMKDSQDLFILLFSYHPVRNLIVFPVIEILLASVLIYSAPFGL